MPVVNLHHTGRRVPEGAVEIHRGTVYGNPFTHLTNLSAPVQVASREEAVEAYRIWLTSDLEVPGWPKPTREQVIALRGRTLACWCAPRACHGDVLLELAETWSEG